MSDGTKIEWTDATWNPVTGCSVVSPGCTNCYAMRLAGTRLRHHPTRAGLTVESKAGPVWNGQVRFNEKALLEPLRWSRPRMIFVCAHGDLFHEGVPDEWIDRVFAIMTLCPQHTFQVLTKRPARMREYLTEHVKGPWAGRVTRVDADGTAHPEWDAAFRVRSVMTDMLSKAPARALNDATAHLDRLYGEDGYDGFMPYWPLPNVWLGTSVEDQRRADERIPELLATPAAVRFISAEPLLGPIDLNRIHEGYDTPEGGRVDMWESCLNGKRFDPWSDGDVDGFPKLDWVIVGGESGPGARPMHPDWARSLRDQCAAAGVPFFLKQWGEWAPGGHDAQAIRRVGKKAAGRLLDGVEHNGFPVAAA